MTENFKQKHAEIARLLLAVKGWTIIESLPDPLLKQMFDDKARLGPTVTEARRTFGYFVIIIGRGRWGPGHACAAFPAQDFVAQYRKRKHNHATMVLLKRHNEAPPPNLPVPPRPKLKPPRSPKGGLGRARPRNSPSTSTTPTSSWPSSGR